MMQPFTHTFRVRYAELDPQSVVFNSRYLEYADILVTEFFRDRMAHGMPGEMEFHVRRAEVDYLAPIRAEEVIEGRLEIERLGNSSMVMGITLSGASDTQPKDPSAEDIRARITLVQVHVDLASGRPLAIPDALRVSFGFAPLGTAAPEQEAHNA